VAILCCGDGHHAGLRAPPDVYIAHRALDISLLAKNIGARWPRAQRNDAVTNLA
jgi:hypothetical protein